MLKMKTVLSLYVLRINKARPDREILNEFRYEFRSEIRWGISVAKSVAKFVEEFVEEFEVGKLSGFHGLPLR